MLALLFIVRASTTMATSLSGSEIDDDGINQNIGAGYNCQPPRTWDKWLNVPLLEGAVQQYRPTIDVKDYYYTCPSSCSDWPIDGRHMICLCYCTLLILHDSQFVVASYGRWPLDQMII